MMDTRTGKKSEESGTETLTSSGMRLISERELHLTIH